MGVKISELPSAQNSNDNDLFVIVQGNTTKKITKELILQVIANELLDIYDKTEVDDLLDLKTNQSDFEILQENTGNQIELNMNTSTYVLTAILKNAEGVVLNTSTVDLPLESLVKDIQYDNTTKEIVFILQDGTTRRIPLNDLISGLQEEITEQNKLSSDLVDDTNSTHKFVTANEKAQITENEADIEELQTKVTNLEETVNSELEDGVATGTEITVNDSATADASLEIEGNIFLQNTNGYQLIHNTQNNYSSIMGGLTLESYKDGRYRIFGKTISNVQAIISLADGRWRTTGGTYYNSLNAGTYNFKVHFIKGTIARFRARAGNSILTSYSDTGEFTLENDITDFNLYFYLANGNTIDVEFKMMLEKGTVAHDWEPYSNELPAPSITNQIFPLNLKGTNTIKIIDEKNALENTIWTDGKTLYSDGSINDTNNWSVSDFIKLDGENTYFNIGSGTNPKNIVYDSNKNIINYFDVINGDTDLTQYPNAKYIRLSVPTSSKTLNKLYKQQTKTLTLPNGLEMGEINTHKDKFVKQGDNWIVPNKIQKIASYNGETITTDYISTTGGLDTKATVYYVGDTDLEITDTTLISELDDLYETLRTYLGQTNITVEAEDLPPMMTLNYKKSNRILRSEIDTIKARLDLLEG